MTGEIDKCRKCRTKPVYQGSNYCRDCGYFPKPKKEEPT